MADLIGVGCIRFPDIRVLHGDSKYRPSEGWYDVTDISPEGSPPSWSGMRGAKVQGRKPAGSYTITVATRRGAELYSAVVQDIIGGSAVVQTWSGVRIEFDNVFVGSMWQPPAQVLESDELRIAFSMGFSKARFIPVADAKDSKAAPPPVVTYKLD
jgi:hypothetical protein